MCRAEDGEPWKVFHKAKLTARTVHKCGECSRNIAPGEFYSRAAGLLDGSSGWVTIKTCSHCCAMSGWLDAMCGGWVYGEVLEELIEHWDEGYKSLAFGRLIAGMKHQWHGGKDPIPVGIGEIVSECLANSVS
jgi:hypothetical protein